MPRKSQTIARLRHCYALNPITALAFYQAGPDHVLLLAGEDTWLQVYDVQSSLLLGQLKVFDSQPIHGIHISSQSSEWNSNVSSGIEGTGVLIWGGHSVTHLPPTSLQFLIRGATPPRPIESKTPDWIYDGILFPSYHGPKKKTRYDGALVTAHNEVLPFSLTTTTTTTSEDEDDSTTNATTTSIPSTTTSITFGPLTSPSRPILYSADLALLAPGVLLVAAGTVFGEIVVWKYFFDWYSTDNNDEDDHGDGDGDGDSDDDAQPPPRRRRWEVLHIFTGHEGSIFGVCISPEMNLPGTGAEGVGEKKRVRLLASCSDDRTVRVWDITERHGVNGSVRGRDRCVVDSRVLVEARETGFGGGDYSVSKGNPNSEARREHKGHDDDQARCVAVAMGHVSRIWHVKFGRRRDHHSSGPGIVEVDTFGEDRSRQRWEFELDWERWAGGEKSGVVERRTGTLRHCGASTCHSGKNIWAAAVLNGGGGDSSLVATGGADGKIVVSGKIRGTGSASDMYEDLDLSLTFDDILQSLHGGTQPPSSEPQGKKRAKNTFQRYAFLSDKIMAATASGRLFLATMGDPLAWEEVSLSEAVVSDLKPYNVVKSPARDTAVLGSPSGKVYLFRRGHNLQEITSFSQKISDIILLDSSPDRTLDEQQHAWSVVITVLGLDHAFLLHFDPCSDISTIDPRKIRLPEHYIVTAAAFIGRGTLVLGSRTGSVSVYTTDPDTGDFTPLTSRKDCKTKDAVTSIVPIPGSSSSSGSNTNEFLTTCRDGKYRIYTFPSSSSPSSTSTTDDAGPVLTLQHEATPPLNTLESAFFTTPKDDNNNRKRRELIILGFHGPNFLSYNASSRTVLFSVACGGAHRPFASVSAPHDPGQTRFVFSKSGELRVVSQGGVGEKVLRGGGHGREVRSVASSFHSSSSSSSSLRWGKGKRVVNGKEKEGGDDDENGRGHGGDRVLVATAAEDTAIRIWRHTPSSANPDSTGGDKDNMDCLAVVEGHSAGIQTLRWFTPRYLLSSAGSEELFVWRVSHTNSPGYSTLTVMREAVWENDDGTGDRDLRIVDFDAAALPPPPTPLLGDDGDRGVAMLISMGLSDSSVRSYIYYSPSTSPSSRFSRSPGGGGGGKFARLATARYTGACPTQVRHLRVGPGKHEHEHSPSEVHLLTAFTDGHVAVWRTTLESSTDTDTEFTLCWVARLHQSSIKSLDLVSGSSGSGSSRWLVVTGGDDNALGFMDLAWDADKDKGMYVAPAPGRRYRVRDAHAAAITGVCVVRMEEEEAGVTQVVATVSNDQRVKLWRVERRTKDDGGGRIRVAMLDDRYSSVADAGDLELIAPGKLMVGGVGMEMWHAHVPLRSGEVEEG
ncbi:putative cytosolic iron-sulfur protein assembly protein 1 [Achaetomium macrosporum]|uniref:Cytosolic iron-sulfur protein assembly protein 1 n=1 Tax=Achaetomium macrosporum TaxID=79813 RepID=A0AAN7CD53_9PEZI|nr:putative cytosolic iron-sulfur protein assembly protein 1 [Achaetomium macrosporum]